MITTIFRASVVVVALVATLCVAQRRTMHSAAAAAAPRPRSINLPRTRRIRPSRTRRITPAGIRAISSIASALGCGELRRRTSLRTHRRMLPRTRRLMLPRIRRHMSRPIRRLCRVVSSVRDQLFAVLDVRTAATGDAAAGVHDLLLIRVRVLLLQQRRCLRRQPDVLSRIQRMRMQRRQSDQRYDNRRSQRHRGEHLARSRRRRTAGSSHSFRRHLRPRREAPRDRPGQALEPEPAGNNGSAAEGTHEGGTGNSGAYFEAPKLFSPNDRTAQRSIAPVKMAVYEQPVRHQQRFGQTSWS